MAHILFCHACNKFTMEAVCSCGGKTTPVHPPKYSPKDAYASYRRQAKEADWRKQGLL